jgi:hydrogenase nickel incorporation protein HypB
MCATCGCHEQHEHHHAHADHDHAPDGHRLIRLEHDVLARNDALAAVNRRRLAERGAVAINLLASPGAGKTTLLERTIRELRAEIPLVVIEGDQATDADAARIRAAGAPAVQVNTGTGCHLDAAMVARALDELDPPAGAVVLIENVGNLVCPALFDLGEAVKVVVASVPEGDDKPTKYPHMFRAAGLVLLNKIDLAPHVAFDRERWRARVHSVNPGVETLAISATGGAGLDAWYAWLRACRATELRPA